MTLVRFSGCSPGHRLMPEKLGVPFGWEHSLLGESHTQCWNIPRSQSQSSQ